MNLGFIRSQKVVERTGTLEPLRPNMALGLSFNLSDFTEKTAGYKE